jgi:Protein of unknown function (DUF3631)
MDEADRYLNEETAGQALTAAINASSYKRLACKKICIPAADGGWEVIDFNFWCPMIMAGIKALVDTIQDRSIVLVMHRAKPGELKANLVNGTSDVLQEIQRKLARWAKDLGEIDLFPTLPPFLHNREADLWRPLFAIAALTGHDWPGRVQRAATKIYGQRAEDEARLTLLLEAIKEEFGTSEQMFTADRSPSWSTARASRGQRSSATVSHSTPTTCTACLRAWSSATPSSGRARTAARTHSISTPRRISRRPGQGISRANPHLIRHIRHIRHSRPKPKAQSQVRLCRIRMRHPARSGTPTRPR